MSYASMGEMVQSNSLNQRVVAAAAESSIPMPDMWTQQRMWQIVASPGWDEAWDYAKDNSTLEHNPDTGARPGVISDAMILSAAQALFAQETAP